MFLFAKRKIYDIKDNFVEPFEKNLANRYWEPLPLIVAPCAPRVAPFTITFTTKLGPPRFGPWAFPLPRARPRDVRRERAATRPLLDPRVSGSAFLFITVHFAFSEVTLRTNSLQPPSVRNSFPTLNSRVRHEFLIERNSFFLVY